jgi:hypothetical protein
MAERFQSQLQAGFDAGALGLTRDGMVEVRDASKLALKDRVAITQRWPRTTATARPCTGGRRRQRAPGMGGADRETFAAQWIASARSGWWYQDGGGWKQK